MKKKSPYFFNDPKLSKLAEEKNSNINLDKLKNIKDPDINELRRKYLNIDLNEYEQNNKSNQQDIEEDNY